MVKSGVAESCEGALEHTRGEKGCEEGGVDVKIFVAEEEEVVGKDRDVAAELIGGQPLPREGGDAGGVNVGEVVGGLHCLEVLVGVEGGTEERRGSNADRQEEKEGWQGEGGRD